jgi:hypothetical protein
MLAIDWQTTIQAILFALFAGLTALLSAIIGPTYDNLLVPELSPGALFPPLGAAAPGGANFLAPAARFSDFLLVGVVDPAIALLAIGVALLYLARSLTARWAATFEGLLPRLVLAVVAANFTIPIAQAVLSVAAALFPVVAGWDGGAWQNWSNLAGWGQLQFSWDNGVAAFVLAFVEFALVLLLVLAVAARDALLAVLVVLLPVVTLLWPFRPLSSIPRRSWLLFAELAFLPSVLVIPLELAVGSPDPEMLIAYLGVALSAPFLLSASGSHLLALGFPSAGTQLPQATQRGLSAAPGAAAGYAAPAASAVRSTGAAGAAVAGGIRAVGSASAPAAPPLAVAELLGHGALRLARHVGGRRADRPPPFPPVRPGGAR